MLSDADMKIVNEYNHKSGLQLLKESYKHNKVDAGLTKAQYRFMMKEGLIVRGSTGIRHGMVYILTELGLKELREMGVDAKEEPLRKCLRCGKEAWIVEDLKDFELNWAAKHHRDNKCKACEKKERIDMKGKRIE